MTVFSRPAVPGPSSGYDPAWTGDPLREHPGQPGVGYGESYVGRTSTVHERPRNPIGFAPPQRSELEPPARFRTEISFRRHNELPRASAVSDLTDSARPPWQTPEVTPAPADEAPAAQVSFAEFPSAESVLPFYRREISFRRKKVDPNAVDETTEAVDEIVVEEAADAEFVDEVAEIEHRVEAVVELDEPTVVAEIEHEVGEVVAEVEPEFIAEADVRVEENFVTASVSEARPVPFYKRELGFRKKKTVEAPVADAIAPVEEHGDAPVEAVVLPPAVDEPALDVTPSFKPASSETGPAPADVLAAAVVLPVVEDAPAVEDEPVAAPDEDRIAEPEIVADAESAADEPEPVEDRVEADDLPVADAGEADDEAASSNGRFSRKAKPPKEKTGKRKGNQSGKSRRVVGLKIGASQLAAAVVQRTDAGHELLGLARRPLAEGIVVDGDVRDEVALAHALKSFFEEEKLPKSDVRVGLSSNRIGVRSIEMEWIEDAARFDNAVRFKAHEVLPVALNESVLDYRVISSHVDEEGQELRRVLLVVAPRDQVEPYRRVAERAGIRLEGADLEALALLRAFVDPRTEAGRDESETATVAVAIGHESSTLLVAGGGACEFTRVFDWGGSELEDSIATALDVRPVEAATILRHLSLSGPGRQYATLDELGRAKATDAVRQGLTPFARELVNSLQFYQTQTDSLGIGRILLTGGTSHLEGLDAALHQMIGVDVTIGDPFARVIRADEYDPAIEATIGSMAVPIGLAIDEEASRGVNLLPKDAKRSRDTRATVAKVAVPIAAAIPFAALAFLYAGAHGTVGDRQAELQTVKVQIDSLPKPAKPVLETGVVGDEAQRATAVANLLGGRVAWDGVFRDLSRVLPENVWLTTLSVSQPGADGLNTTGAAPQPLPGQAQATPDAVKIEGYTYTQPDVALLLARLSTLPSLQRVTLSSSSAELVGAKPAVHFVIVADLSQTGGAS